MLESKKRHRSSLSSRYLNLSLRRKIYAATMFPVVALVASILSIQIVSAGQQASEDAVRRALEVGSATQGVLNALQATENAAWGAVFKTPSLRSGPDTARILDDKIAHLRSLLSEDTEQLRPLLGFESKVKAELEMYRTFTASFLKNGRLPSFTNSSIAQALAVSTAPRLALESVKSGVDRDLQARSAAAQRARVALRVLILVASFVGVGGGFLLTRASSRAIVRRIREVGFNARRLAAGSSVVPIAPNADEVGEVAREIELAARLLSEREKQLRQAKEDAERANLAKSEFLSRMSHELRTPLNSILGFGQLTIMGDISAGDRDNVEHIVKAGRHLLDLINEVLDISRIEAGEFTLSMESLDLKDVVDEVMDLVRPLAADRRVELHASGDARWLVRADRQRLKQILLNLVANAIKYNIDDGSVRIVYEPTKSGRLRIGVTDNGRGIEQKEIERLFTPFERLGEENGEIEGTGLGLALSQRLANAMGTEVRVESAPGCGSTFTLELEVIAGGPDQGRRPESSVATGSQRSGPAILCIEDNLANLTLVERILQSRRDVRLITAMQGRQGVELAQRHRPDLILLDLHLPDVPGDEVLRMLGEDDRTRDIPLVVLSADATSKRIRELREAGAREFITKPIDVNRFLMVVDSLLLDEVAER